MVETVTVGVASVMVTVPMSVVVVVTAGCLVTVLVDVEVVEMCK